MQVITPIKLIVTDSGDPSVGIMQQTWSVDVPFCKEDGIESDLEYFKRAISAVYSEFSQGKLIAVYDFEIVM